MLSRTRANLWRTELKPKHRHPLLSQLGAFVGGAICLAVGSYAWIEFVKLCIWVGQFTWP
jgi:hypothetical protein